MHFVEFAVNFRSKLLELYITNIHMNGLRGIVIYLKAEMEEKIQMSGEYSWKCRTSFSDAQYA